MIERLFKATGNCSCHNFAATSTIYNEQQLPWLFGSLYPLPCCSPLPPPLLSYCAATVYTPHCTPLPLAFPFGQTTLDAATFYAAYFQVSSNDCKNALWAQREREKKQEGGRRGAGNALRTFAVPLAAAGAANFPRTHNFMQIVSVARWQSSAPSPTLCVCAFLVHTLWRRTRLHANMQHDVIRGGSKKFNSLYLLGPISCCATKDSPSLPPLSLSLPCLLMHTQISFS